MANDERDRFGDKLKDAERAREDQYFAKRDRELMEKLRQAEADGARCPKCHGAMAKVTTEGNEVLRCPVCLD